MVPSSSTKLRATIEESDLNEIIDLAKKRASAVRTAQDLDGATYKDVKNYATEVLGPTVSL